MQNPADKSGVANPLEWKEVIANDPSDAVLSPGTNQEKTDEA
jgi:hypothetical protein